MIYFHKQHRYRAGYETLLQKWNNLSLIRIISFNEDFVY